MSDIKHLPRGNVFFAPLQRTGAVLIVGAILIGLSATAQFKGFGWINDSKSGLLPVMECPSLSVMIYRHDFVDAGKFCEVTVFNWEKDARSYLSDFGSVGEGYSCNVPYFEVNNDNGEEFKSFTARNPIVCKVNQPCSQTRVCTQDINGGTQTVDCPRGPEEAASALNQGYMNVLVLLNENQRVGFYSKWENYKSVIFMEFCDSDFNIPVAKIVALRGLIAALGLIAISWLFIDIVAHGKGASSTRRAKRIHAENEANLDSAKENFYANLSFIYSGSTTPVEAPLKDFERSLTVTTPESGMKTRLVAASSSARQSGSRFRSAEPMSFKMNVCEDPVSAFTSINWRNKIQKYLNRRHASNKSHWSRYLFTPIFVIVFGGLVSWAYLAISPSDLVNTHSIADTMMQGYGSVWSAWGTWIILPFLFLDDLLDLMIFFTTCFVVKWGRQTVFSKVVGVAEKVSNRDEDELLTESLSSIDDIPSISAPEVVEDSLIPNCVAAVICIDTFRMDDEDQFLENVMSVINCVGIHNTFILQFGSDLSPQDDTVALLQNEVNRGIQYLYVPERDRLAAVYWFSKYYIPLVQLHQEIFAPTAHLMVVDQRVAVPATLSIPHQYVSGEEEVGLICFGCTSKTIAPLCDVQLKLDVCLSIFESDMSSLGDSEVSRAMVTVWDREALEFAAFNHKPLTESNGGDFPGAGIEIFKSDRKNRIKFVSNNLIEVKDKRAYSTVEKLYLDLARRKRLLFIDIRALISHAALLSKIRLASKPKILCHVIAAVFDFIRLPVLFASALRDPIGLGGMIALVLVLQWVRIFVLSVVLIPQSCRKDRPGMVSAMLFPVFHILWNIVVLKPLSIVCALFWSLSDRPGMAILEREDYEHNIPPCLPYPDAPWFTVWKPQL